jgi:hypothetical protein
MLYTAHQARKVSPRVARSPIRPDRRPVVRAAPGLGQQRRFQRVPQVGNRGFRGRIDIPETSGMLAGPAPLD